MEWCGGVGRCKPLDFLLHPAVGFDNPRFPAVYLGFLSETVGQEWCGGMVDGTRYSVFWLYYNYNAY